MTPKSGVQLKLKTATLWAALALGLLTPLSARAEGQLSLLLGSYQFNIKPTGSAAGLGNYSLKYSHTILTQFQAFAGLTFLLSNMVSGQSGYGIDVGANYYPLTDAGVSHDSLGNLDWTSWQKWRPYVGIAVRQRLIQLVTQPNYLGVGGIAGLTYQLSRQFSLDAEFHYDRLAGPNTATGTSTSATQTNVLVGGSFYF